MAKKLSRRQILKVANEVRNEVESFVGIEDEAMGISKLTWSFPDDLAGLCIVASIILFQELKRLGRNPYIVKGNGHYYINCDGFLVDVTASQFCMPRVVVKKLVFRKNLGFVPIDYDEKFQSFWEPNFRARSLNKFEHFSIIAKSIERARISNFNNKRGIYA